MRARDSAENLVPSVERTSAHAAGEAELAAGRAVVTAHEAERALAELWEAIDSIKTNKPVVLAPAQVQEVTIAPTRFETEYRRLEILQRELASYRRPTFAFRPPTLLELSFGTRATTVRSAPSLINPQLFEEVRHERQTPPASPPQTPLASPSISSFQAAKPLQVLSTGNSLLPSSPMWTAVASPYAHSPQARESSRTPPSSREVPEHGPGETMRTPPRRCPPSMFAPIPLVPTAYATPQRRRKPPPVPVYNAWNANACSGGETQTRARQRCERSQTMTRAWRQARGREATIALAAGSASKAQQARSVRPTGLEGQTS